MYIDGRLQADISNEYTKCVLAEANSMKEASISLTEECKSKHPDDWATWYSAQPDPYS